MLKPTDFAPNLLLEPNGLWRSPTVEPISYTEHGNSVCLQLEDASFWFRHRNRCILALCGTYPPPGPLFDVGGGNGFVSLALKNAGFEAVVVEPGPEGARNSQARGLNPVICATLDGAGFRAHSLPAVGVFDVVEHVKGDEGFLRNIGESLVPAGRLYLTVPAYRFLWSDEDDATGHFERYTRRRLRVLLERAGFELEYSTYFFSFLVLPIFFLRALPYRLGIQRAGNAQEQKNDHAGWAARLLARMMGVVLEGELFMIRQRWPVPFGGSILAVARPKARN